jgi:hypothetical protein
MISFKQLLLIKHLPLFCFFLFLFILRVSYFNYFYVPDTDYFHIMDKAVSFLNLELPRNYQRLPFYSILMGLFSLILPTEEPVLIAAEIINLVSFMSACIVLYLLSEKLVGKAAFIVLALFALNPLSALEAAQPRADMLAVTLILLSVYLSDRSPVGSYLAAFCAALTRYEGAFIITALAAKDLLFSRTKLYCLSLSLAASSGLVLWLILNYIASGHINPYFRYMSEPPAGLGFVWILVSTFYSIAGSDISYFIQERISLKVLTGLTTIVISLGFYHFFKADEKVALVIFLYFVQGVIINLVFFAPAVQHTYLVLWVCYLAGVGGIYFLVSQTVTKIKSITREEEQGLSLAGKSLYALFILAGIGVVLFIYRDQGHDQALFWFSMACFLVLLANISHYYKPVRMMRSAVLSGVVIIVIAALCSKNMIAMAERLNSQKLGVAELRLVGEWYSRHADHHLGIVVTEPWVSKYYADPLYRDRFSALESFQVTTTQEFAKEAIRRNIGYVAWNTSHGLSSKEDFYYRKYKVHLIDCLRDGKDIPGFTLTQVLKKERAYAYVYKIDSSVFH